MTDELKPCPFCGGVGHIHKDPDMNWGDFYSVKCSKCRAKSGEFHAAETCPVFYGQVRDAWNTRADLAAPMRCAECDCEKGGADCNWIATPTPLDDPRVEALMDLIKRAEHNIPEYYTLWHADARAALIALEENK